MMSEMYHQFICLYNFGVIQLWRGTEELAVYYQGRLRWTMDSRAMKLHVI